MSSTWPLTPPSPEHVAAVADAKPSPFWLDNLPQETLPSLQSDTTADLCIVGAGFTGLWAALRAKEVDPGRDVVVIEAEAAGFGASGRNGGVAIASLTHGISNGLARFKREMNTLERLSIENFDGLKADLYRYGIDCDFEQNGHMSVAVQVHQSGWLEEDAALRRRFGHDAAVLDATATRAELNTPALFGAVWDRTGTATVDPAKLVAGLRRVALDLGVRIYERTPATALDDAGDTVVVSTPSGRVTAGRVLLATNAFAPLVRRIRRHVVAVYDYVLMTEPLTDEQLASIGWANRQSFGDMSNQFHYFRITADNRILFGGYDAVYRYGSPVGPHLDERQQSFELLSQHFFTMFPQLAGLKFSHRWGGAIDTCSRFSVFFGKSHGGRVVYAAGYTGLGVVSSRFGARAALEVLDRQDTEITRLRYVRRKPLPFPPEPLRSVVIKLTQNRLAAADRKQGRRGLWLRLLDRLGLGFDS